MPRAPIPCPECAGALKIDRSGQLYTDDRTGLLMRECWLHCTVCGKRGKGLLTLDVALFAVASVLSIEPTPFPIDPAA